MNTVKPEAKRPPEHEVRETAPLPLFRPEALKAPEKFYGEILAIRLRKLWSRPRLPLILQAAAAECGLACLAMVAGYHGLRIDLGTLRRRFSISLRGTTLGHLLRFGGQLGLAGRALRIELEDLPYLNTPCLLHWNMDHFVVLKRATGRRVWIHDPAVGLRRLTYAKASRHFTGVALELTPTATFARGDQSRSFGVRDLTGRVAGVAGTLGKIFILAAALEMLFLISPLFLQFVVDRVIAASKFGLLATAGAGFALLVLLQTLLGALRSWTTLSFGTSLKLQWYANIFSHLVRLPVSFFEKRYFGDIMSRFDGAEALQRTLTNNFIEAILDGIISIFMLAVMCWYSAKLALVVVVTVLLYVTLRNVAYRPLRGLTEEQIIRMAQQQTFLIETLRGIRTIKVFGRESNRQNRWMNLVVDSTNAQVATEKLAILFKSANTLVFGLQSVVVIWLGAGLVVRGAFTVGMLFAFVAYQEQFKARVTALVDRLFEFRMLSLQVQRLADITLEKPESVSLEPDVNLAGHAGIEVRSLCFRYSDTEPWLLEDVNLTVEPGECVAITGPSGAGKSTLLKLMAGLLQPQQGEIVIGGRSLANGRAMISTKVGFVLQDDSLFGGTIADNIAFAADTADMAKVETCARMACLHDDVLAMPMGYGTLIGDMGSALSGGQQQRLLLARALYAEPSILILDEATSHLDVATEQRIAAMLAELKITRVFAAHRPETVAIASRVIALQHPASRRSAHDARGKFGPTQGPKSEKGAMHVTT